jgi:hypothetical protein
VSHVDFTLEDVEQMMGRALIKEREYNRAAMQGIASQIQATVTTVITAEFASFWENNLGPVLEEMHSDIQELKRASAQPR